MNAPIISQGISKKVFDLLIESAECDTGNDLEQVGFSGTIKLEINDLESIEYYMNFSGNKEYDYKLFIDDVCVRHVDLFDGPDQWIALYPWPNQMEKMQNMIYDQVDEIDQEFELEKNGLKTKWRSKWTGDNF